jgi:hypothetical protein
VSGGCQGTPGWGDSGQSAGWGPSALRWASLRWGSAEAISLFCASETGERGTVPTDWLGLKAVALPLPLSCQRAPDPFEDMSMLGLVGRVLPPRSDISTV